MAVKKNKKKSVTNLKTITASKTKSSMQKKKQGNNTKPPTKAEQKVFVKAWASKQKLSSAFGAAASVDQTVENLSKIDHIVVLMLENRSFDHMLGYLKLHGGRNDIDGLDANFSNVDSTGTAQPVFPLGQTAFPKNAADPCHEFDCIDEQLKSNNGGFVKNYGKHNAANPKLVMGYYQAEDVPVYDHLAKHFATFNRWFASIRAATWPNRLYSIAGRASGKKSVTVPLYNLPSFVRHLDARNVSWGWFNHKGFGTLRMIDPHYRAGHFDKFAYFDRRKDFISGLFGDPSFVERAQNGTLPSVSWIDPNFINAPGASIDTSNDDHPPSDIKHGQELVLKLYNAVTTGPKWDKTMLIVTYDEHGGFYDHVAPGNALDDSADCQQYGVRVPAFVVSPFCEAGVVSDAVFDHTSIIKTILLRFCLKDNMYPDMGSRVRNANHLGSLLSRETPRTAPSNASVVNAITSWKKELFKESIMLSVGSAAPTTPNDLQKGIVAASKKIKKTADFPEDQP